MRDSAKRIGDAIQYAFWWFVREILTWPNLRYRIRRYTVYAWQRARRGWADNDVWRTHDYLEEVIVGMLERMADTNRGCPIDFSERHGGNAERGAEEWARFLRQAASDIRAWGEFEDSDNLELIRGDFKEYCGRMEEAHARKTKALRRLADVWDNLWD